MDRYCLSTILLLLINCKSVIPATLPTECGLKQVNAGGEIPKTDHWPWVVGVYDKNTKNYICGGSLINQRVILSVAHCFTDANGALLSSDSYVIGAGKQYHDFNHTDDNHAQYSDVEHIYIPSEYIGEAQNYRADISVVVVKEAFKLSNHIRPVCVDWNDSAGKEQLKKGSKGTIVSWGTSSEGGSRSPEFKQLELPFIETADCMKFLPNNFKRFLTPGDKICGGYQNITTTICIGDSGGGYFFEKNGRYFIRGIESLSSTVPHGSMCDLTQQILFTNVSKYEEFIHKYESQYRPS